MARAVMLLFLPLIVAAAVVAAAQAEGDVL
jgi:hypothetical protein